MLVYTNTHYSVELNILISINALIYYHSFTATSCITSVALLIIFKLYFILSDQLFEIFSPLEKHHQ